ncbi:MAG: M14 family zinc carboxypeptidase [Planctomycetota bacterium]
MADAKQFTSEYGPPIWPPFEKLQAVLERWHREHPSVMKLRAVGRSIQGRPVYVVQLTDPDTDNRDKEHALITALHSGVERNAATTVFAIIEWLLSDDPLAREILRQQVVVCMPIPTPDCYVEGKHGNVYGPWTLNGPPDPNNMPEAMAVKAVMDEYQPEVHADIHGLSMGFEKYIMLENTGSSYSNLALRCYHRDVMRLMDDAALAEGYPSDWQESDAERIFWGPALDGVKNKLWVGRPQIYAAIYCYHHYHTMLSASEVCWERSGVLRHRRLLEIGNEKWPGEYYPGYPTRVILSNNYHMVTAYGRTAAARRRSRVDLWGKLGQIAFGQIDPFVEGKVFVVCATSPSAVKGWLGGNNLEDAIAKIGKHPGVNAESIRRFTAGWPHGQNRPEAYVDLRTAEGKPEDATPIEHGLALRLRIPYAKAKIRELLVNGQPVAASETAGYVTWTAREYLYVQINIPPERSRAEDLFIVTCDYDPGDRRLHWEGWKNP